MAERRLVVRNRAICPNKSTFGTPRTKPEQWDTAVATGAGFVVDDGTTAGLGHKDFSAIDVDEQPAWVT